MPDTIQSGTDDPTRAFSEPQDVVDSDALTRDEKVRMLKQWELDARGLAVAEEEGMGGGESNRLKRVLDALKQLGVEADSSAAGTKHGH